MSNLDFILLGFACGFVGAVWGWVSGYRAGVNAGLSAAYAEFSAFVQSLPWDLKVEVRKCAKKYLRSGK